MTDIELIERAVEEEAERILAANDRIWEFAELPFHEDKSAGLLCGLLEESGFTVETGLGGEFQPVLREHFRLAQEDR